MPLNFGSLSAKPDVLTFPENMGQAPDLSHIEDSREYRRALKALAVVTGKAYLDARHYHSDGQCFKCPNCGATSRDFLVTVEEMVQEGIVSEQSVTCDVCHTNISHWSCGSYILSYALIEGDTDVL